MKIDIKILEELKRYNSINSYINDFVICSKCGIPEINYTLVNNIVEARCSACGSINDIKNNNKINQKVVDIILKYLQMYINVKGVLMLFVAKELNHSQKGHCPNIYMCFLPLNSRFVLKEMELIHIVFGSVYI